MKADSRNFALLPGSSDDLASKRQNGGVSQLVGMNVLCEYYAVIYLSVCTAVSVTRRKPKNPKGSSFITVYGSSDLRCKFLKNK